jgi:hypothetical protein
MPGEVRVAVSAYQTGIEALLARLMGMDVGRWRDELQWAREFPGLQSGPLPVGTIWCLTMEDKDTCNRWLYQAWSGSDSLTVVALDLDMQIDEFRDLVGTAFKPE